MHYEVESEDDLRDIADKLLAGLKKGKQATLVALSGELGSGKTTFTKYLADLLGVEEHVTSPTYVLEKVYELEGQTFDHLIHIDAYRLEGAYELENLGFTTLLKDPRNLIVLEWPERVEEILPDTCIRITFSHSGEGKREITIHE